MTDLLRSVGQGEAQARVNADAALDRQVWDQQAAVRKEMQERLASYKSEKKKLRAKRTLHARVCAHARVCMTSCGALCAAVLSCILCACCCVAFCNRIFACHEHSVCQCVVRP